MYASRLHGSWLAIAAALVCGCQAGTKGGTLGSGGRAGAGQGGGGAGGVAGRGSQGTAGTGLGGQVGPGLDAGDPSPDALNCGLQDFKINLDPPEILVVLDRSETMSRNLADKDPAAGEPTKWSYVIPALKDVIQASRPDMSWGLKLFPQSGGEQCENPTLTTLIDIPVAPGNHAQVAAAAEAAIPDGDGTPTGAAVFVAAEHLRSLNNTKRKYVVLVTDGQPSCTGRPGGLSYNPGDAARSDSVNAVAAALQAGFPTFVIGVATTKTNDVDTLNALAQAGGVPACPNCPLAKQFYDGANKEQIEKAFADVADAASACIFPLSAKPPVPDKVGVYVGAGMSKAPRSTTDGWEYTDASQSTIQVNGSWCNMIKTAGGNTVQIIFGCPLIDVP